jgi:hypothetical protein
MFKQRIRVSRRSSWPAGSGAPARQQRHAAFVEECPHGREAGRLKYGRLLVPET